MPAPISTSLPSAPSSSDAPAVFEEKAFAFVGALEPFRVDLQAQADFVNDNVGPGSDAETVANIAADVSTVAAVAPDVALLAYGQVSKTELTVAYGSEFWDGWVSEDKYMKFGDNIGQINYTALGYDSTSDSFDLNMFGSNDTLTISDAGAVKFTFTGSTGSLVASGDIQAFSDKRLKTNIIKIDNALEKCKKINGYNYDRIDLRINQNGVLAQELLEILPESVNVGTDYMSVSYNGVIALLVNCINELSQKVEDLECKNDTTS